MSISDSQAMETDDNDEDEVPPPSKMSTSYGQAMATDDDDHDEDPPRSDTNLSELDGPNPVFEKDLEHTRDKHNTIFQELRETLFGGLAKYRAKRLVLVEEREKKLNDIALQDPEAGRILSSDHWYRIPPDHDLSLSQDGTMIHWFPDQTGLSQPLTYSRQLSQYFLHKNQVSALNYLTCIHLMTWLTYLTIEPTRHF
jgi:hypothetical protein